MDIINDISKLNIWLGEKTLDYINKLDPIDKEKILTCDNNDKLFEICYEYGVLSILRYLFEFKKIQYNIKLLTGVFQVSDKIYGSSITHWTKYQRGKEYCYKYLVYMKKYSKYKFDKGNFIYFFKYESMDNERIDKMVDNWVYNFCG